MPGYQLRLVDDQGNVVTKPGELGELQISGPTSAIMYWNQREKTKNTFQGPWTRSGDKYSVDKEGYYAYGGRSDDMLKVSGIYVSPVEVEAALITHEAVLEAAVVGAEDEQKLVKPKAYVVLKQGTRRSRALKHALQQHVKDKLAPYKYPRWIEFMSELPKTATGKIQRGFQASVLMPGVKSLYGYERTADHERHQRSIRKALYLEEIFTDRRVGTIRRLTPVTKDAVRDEARAVLYVGETQVLTPAGALPIGFEIGAGSLEEAAEKFGQLAREAIERTVKELQELRRQAASQIVVPQGPLPPMGGAGGGKIQMP